MSKQRYILTEEELLNLINNTPNGEIYGEECLKYYQPVIHAHWKRIDEYVYGEPWECSNCEETNSWRSRYCPNCGAEMTFNGKQETESKNIKSSLEYDYCGIPKFKYDIKARI